ncbi:hypothetical protein NQ838_15195 [Acinetobacter baumannii]|uniref:hypothetical protein n=1 Tax=Acinetobacter baumannii TaxID=470 RepID=UPI0004476ADB|nr:hypothetical protein [Acinetobacter baumannii]EKU0425616.1 hypothetical protein [Acinetobacter baumannii]EKU1554734.1 hypothetical protein [Acinetobacter baumannii]EKU2694507.1 hypothetical protein [Acinetobacter baumannii]EKU5259165.1 hypothetical protein [Acinetobacter baumannii]EKU6965562.1 hypothetical protein [Acinetobacter baumannii]
MQQASIFKGPKELPESDNTLVVFFKDGSMSSPVRYCSSCEEWHSPAGDLRESNIHQWAYKDEFYEAFNIPKFEGDNTEKESNAGKDRAAEMLFKLVLLSALSSATKQKSHSFF